MTFGPSEHDRAVAIKATARKTIPCNPFISLPERCSEFVHESGQQFVHNPFHIGVRKGLLQILQDKAKGILLLAGRDLVAPVDIEQSHALEKLLGRLERAPVKVGIADILIKQEGKVPADLRELGQFLESDYVPLHEFEQGVPVDLRSEDRLLHVELLSKRRKYSTHDRQRQMCSRQRVRNSLTEYVAGSGSGL